MSEYNPTREYEERREAEYVEQSTRIGGEDTAALSAHRRTRRRAGLPHGGGGADERRVRGIRGDDQSKDNKGAIMHPDSQPVERLNEPARHMSDHLKVKINTLLWAELPPHTTIETAEKIAVEIFNRIEAEWETPKENVSHVEPMTEEEIDQAVRYVMGHPDQPSWEERAHGLAKMARRAIARRKVLEVDYESLRQQVRRLREVLSTIADAGCERPQNGIICLYSDTSDICNTCRARAALTGRDSDA